MGRMAGEMLVPDPLREVQADAHEVQPELIVRESTAKAGA
jgi:DNA-binding LacI/PurR family transcriptional regulator